MHTSGKCAHITNVCTVFPLKLPTQHTTLSSVIHTEPYYQLHAATHIFPRNIVERGRDTVNVTVSGQGTKVQCGLRDSGQGHSTNTSILLPGYSSVFPLLSRGTDHTLYCTNKGTQCTGFELTVTGNTV